MTMADLPPLNPPVYVGKDDTPSPPTGRAGVGAVSP